MGQLPWVPLVVSNKQWCGLKTRRPAVGLCGALLLRKRVERRDQATGRTGRNGYNAPERACDDIDQLSHELLATREIRVGPCVLCREGVAIGDTANPLDLSQALRLLLDDLRGIDGILLEEDVGAGPLEVFDLG